MLPLARHEDLLVEELPEELLVYDLKSFRAHCLNRAAAIVWRACDGRTTVEEMARRVGEKLEIPQDDTVVRLALAQLRKARLMETPLARDEPRVSRRDVLRRLGIAAALLPLVHTIVAPDAMAASNAISPAACSALLPPSCGGLICLGQPTKNCKTQGGACVCK